MEDHDLGKQLEDVIKMLQVSRSASAHEHARQIIQCHASAPLAGACDRWYSASSISMSTLDSEYMSPTFRSEVDREVEMLFGSANHATDSMLVPSVRFGMFSLGDRVFHTLMNNMAE